MAYMRMIQGYVGYAKHALVVTLDSLQINIPMLTLYVVKLQ